MSELEKLKRDEYQKRRKEIIYFLTAIALILAFITASFSIIFISLDANTYVFYEEKGSALYHAYLNDNEYYEEDRLNGSHAYISSLIHHMDVAFRYESKMEAEDVKYQYQYRVDAQLVIEDAKTKSAIYNPTETILGPTNRIYEGKKLVLAPTVEIDYVSYNQKAIEFIDKYRLTDVTSYLKVTMYVEVIGMSQLFASDNEDECDIQVKIPLTQNVLKPEISTSIAEGPQKVLANPNKGKTLFKVLAIIFGVLDAGVIGYAVYYTLKTRDMHIDYSRKVQRLVNNYKSFIQKINNPFDSAGYQILMVEDFNAMLEIRDTLQLPILMYENLDRTCTTFVIPLDSRLLYTFEIKVENYDELYSPVRLGGDDIDAEIARGIKVDNEKQNWWTALKEIVADIFSMINLGIDSSNVHISREDIMAEELAEAAIAEESESEKNVENEMLEENKTENNVEETV